MRNKQIRLNKAQIATGWGDTEEIEQRKLDGWRAVRAVVMVAQ